MIKDKIKLLKQADSILDKIKVLRYFLTRKMNRCKIKISEKSSIFVRENKPNDMFMALNYDDSFFNDIKVCEFKRIIDIGANIGRYSLMFSENKDSKVIAFEPVRANHKALIKNIQLNERFNISAHRCGIYNKDSLAKINLCETNEGGHSLTYPRGGYKTEVIKVKKLDTILETEYLFKPDFIKIDVEGAELQVLEGAEQTINKYRPVIYLEILDTAEDKELIFKFLKEKGYKINKEKGSNYFAIPK